MQSQNLMHLSGIPLTNTHQYEKSKPTHSRALSRRLGPNDTRRTWSLLRNRHRWRLYHYRPGRRPDDHFLHWIYERRKKNSLLNLREIIQSSSLIFNFRKQNSSSLEMLLLSINATPWPMSPVSGGRVAPGYAPSGKLSE